MLGSCDGSASHRCLERAAWRLVAFIMQLVCLGYFHFRSWEPARVGECHVVLQEMVNMCGCYRILCLFVHAADEVISSYGLFALLSEARSFLAVDF